MSDAEQSIDDVSPHEEPEPLPDEERKKLSLIGKLSAMLAEVSRIKKRGWNDFHKYHFATESDVSDMSRKLQAKYRVFFHFGMKPDSLTYEVIKIGDKHKMRSMFVELLTIYDGDSDQKLVSEFPAYSHDTDDKGANKALTTVRKYATLTTLQIPTGDDPDAHSNGQDSRAPREETQRNNNRQNNNKPAAQRTNQQSGGKPPANAKPAAAAPDGMQGRSFEKLAEKQRVLALQIYRSMGVDPKSPAGVHDALLQVVHGGTDGAPNRKPVWWDRFSVHALEQFLAAHPLKSAIDTPKDNTAQLTPAQVHDSLVRRILIAATPWEGTGHPTKADQAAALIWTASQLGLAETPTRWRDISPEQLTAALATLNTEGAANDGKQASR